MAERPEDLNLPNAVITRIIKEAVGAGPRGAPEMPAPGGPGPRALPCAVPLGYRGCSTHCSVPRDAAAPLQLGSSAVPAVAL